jgi:beta-glucosidase-like glycosyl hydrolase
VTPASHRNLAGVDGDGRNRTSTICTAGSQYNLAGEEIEKAFLQVTLAVNHKIGMAHTDRQVKDLHTTRRKPGSPEKRQRHAVEEKVP